VLVAVSLAEDSQADIDGHVDQGATFAAGGRNLVTLGLSKGSNAGIHGDIDQSVGGAVLVALNLAEDGSAESNRNVDQALGGVDTLYWPRSVLDTSWEAPVQGYSWNLQRRKPRGRREK
jgi:hypothetical protein